MPTPLAVKTRHIQYDDSSANSSSASLNATTLALIRPLIGKFRYLVSCTRPDLCFAVNFLSRFMHAPTRPHWHSLKRCIHYLQATKHFGLLYHKSSNPSPTLHLTGWSDSDWGGEISSRKSTAGGVFVFAGASISWFSKKQGAVALSSAEAEFVALARTSKEGIWLSMVLKELLPQTQVQVKLLCDNLSCIQLASNLKHSEKTKHVDIKYHFIRELVEQKKIHLSYTSTHIMWAELLTKPLAAEKFCLCRKHIGVVQKPS
ncbi:hypothetical protein KP509_13G034500 [Ceratopteris richardii]|uniref:Uncharacterized protein n=1 Tax=Ceratopteris richardii TaxID=49495 RepID=A0A8T2TEK3_CERRI|nr:hypothetical protein KP509_13G034500 [Ceratopteris richardii]